VPETDIGMVNLEHPTALARFEFGIPSRYLSLALELDHIILLQCPIHSEEPKKGVTSRIGGADIYVWLKMKFVN
jgi:hypothetical protein